MMMLKINQAVKEYGMCRSRFYQDIADGLMVRPVRMGERARLVPADELRAIIRARIAEKPEAEIKALVQKLHAGRQSI